MKSKLNKSACRHVPVTAAMHTCDSDFLSLQPDLCFLNIKKKVVASERSASDLYSDAECDAGIIPTKFVSKAAAALTTRTR